MRFSKLGTLVATASVSELMNKDDDMGQKCNYNSVSER